MFEFINYGIVIISVMVILIFSMMFYANKKSNLNNSFSVFIIVSLVVVNIYMPYNSKVYAQNNIAAFENAKDLKCINENYSYLVSKKNSWKIDDNYFKKNGFIFRVDMCEVDQ